MSDDQYARTGRIMFILVWIILVIGFALFFYYYQNADTSIYKTNSREYSITADAQGHYRIRGKLNDFPVTFLVDTGATLVAVPQEVADQLKIRGRYPITISTANGNVTGFLTRLEELSFGDFTLYNTKAVIIPNGDNQDVLLGMNVLALFNMAQQNNRLVLKK